MRIRECLDLIPAVCWVLQLLAKFYAARMLRNAWFCMNTLFAGTEHVVRRSDSSADDDLNIDGKR